MKTERERPGLSKNEEEEEDREYPTDQEKERVKKTKVLRHLEEETIKKKISRKFSFFLNIFFCLTSHIIQFMYIYIKLTKTYKMIQ